MPTHDKNSNHSNSWKSQYANLLSRRKVREIVSVSGRGPRGRFPSYKAPIGPKFESLIEEALLRVLEISPVVRTFETQPAVFQFSGTAVHRYTPDARAEIREEQIFFEAKHDDFRKSASVSTRLKEICKLTRAQGIRLVVVLGSDLRKSGLQESLTKVLRNRPAPGRFRTGIDATKWDPLNRQQPDFETLYNWQIAQRECDALLARVMRRDPDEIFSASN